MKDVKPQARNAAPGKQGGLNAEIQSRIGHQLRAMYDDVVRQGKVRYIGFSNFMSWQATTAVMLQERLGLEKYVTAQMYYSLVGRGLEYEFQSFAECHNIGILVWSPLAGGFLSGKYTRTNPAAAGT